MKALKRYFLLLLCLAAVYLIYRVIFDHGSSPCFSTHQTQATIPFSQYIANRNNYYKIEAFQRPVILATNVSRNTTKQGCHMDTCFDFSRCKQMGQNVKIFIYPNDGQHASPTFLKIINFIKESKYYEPDPNKGESGWLHSYLLIGDFH